MLAQVDVVVYKDYGHNQERINVPRKFIYALLVTTDKINLRVLSQLLTRPVTLLPSFHARGWLARLASDCVVEAVS